MWFFENISEVRCDTPFYLVSRNSDLPLSPDNGRVTYKEPVGRGVHEKSLFLFNKSLRITASGPLLFRFNCGLVAESIDYSHKLLNILYLKYSFHPSLAKFYLSYDKSITVAISDNLFRENVCGLYLPIILTKMLDTFDVYKFSALDKTVYSKGIYSSFPFPGGLNPLQYPVHSLTYEELCEKGRILEVDFNYIPALNNNSPTLSQQKLNITNLYKECRSKVFDDMLAGKIQKCALGTGFDSPANFKLARERCIFLKNLEIEKLFILEKSSPNIFFYIAEQFFLICRCFDDFGEQLALLFIETISMSALECTRYNKILSDVYRKNRSPDRCSKLRKKGLCSQLVACGVYHPVELAYSCMDVKPHPYATAYTFLSETAGFIEKLKFFLKRRAEEYVYYRDIYRSFYKHYDPEVIAEGIHVLGVKKLLLPVTPLYTHSRGRRPSQLYLKKGKELYEPVLGSPKPWRK